MELVDKKLAIKRLASKTGLREDTIEIVISAIESDIKEFFRASGGTKVYQVGFLILTNSQMDGYEKQLMMFYNEA